MRIPGRCTYKGCKDIPLWYCVNGWEGYSYHCTFHRDYNLDGAFPHLVYKLIQATKELEDKARECKESLDDILIDWHMRKEVRI